jgi:transposase-like protein
MIASHNDHASAPRPYCQSTDIVRHGTTSEGKQRYRYRRDSGYCAGVTRQSGHRHQRTQKKASALQQVNQAVLQYLHPEQGEVELCRADELDLPQLSLDTAGHQ